MKLIKKLRRNMAMMIRIKCDSVQKDAIIDALSDSDSCVIDDDLCEKYCCCRICLEENIEWEIVDE